MKRVPAGPALPDPQTDIVPGLPREIKAILLIDDHADTLRSLARLLTRNQYHVTTACRYDEGLAKARGGTFDLIISDLGLPDGSGLNLIAEIRQFCVAPAIALSGYGMEEDVAKTLAAGFNRHLTKPVTFPVLLASIRQLMSAAV